MTVGALVFGCGTWLFMQPSITGATWLFGIISGLLWALGQGFQFRSMQQVGVSTAVPISTGMQLVANAVAGALLFHEWRSGRDVTLGIIAVGILVIGAALTSRKEKVAVTVPNHMGKGIQSLIISTIGYAGYTVVYTAAGLDAAAVVLPQAVGMVLGAIVLSFGHQVVTRATAKNIATGLLWGVGNLFMLMATKSVGLAIAFSMSQMGIVISTFGGIFLLGEEKTRKEMVYVTVGSLLVILGGVVLGVMKA